jgi:hypothetical protein
VRVYQFRHIRMDRQTLEFLKLSNHNLSRAPLSKFP